MKEIKEKSIKLTDRIEGNKIILHDNLPRGYQDLKSVLIKRGDKICHYMIRRTGKGGYLFQ